MIVGHKHSTNLLQVDKMHTLQPGAKEGLPAECTTAAIIQQGGQRWVVGKHRVDQRRLLPVLLQNKSGSQFLGNRGDAITPIQSY